MIKAQTKEVSRMMKPSMYNFLCNDEEGNMIIYNFLVGIPSITEILKEDIDEFRKMFLDNNAICSEDMDEKSIVLLKKLASVGILVDSDVDESLIYESRDYEEVFDNRLHLTILPTGKCNFSCSYCMEEEQPLFKERMTEDGQVAVIKYVQKNIKNYNGLHISWFGGEPLLEKNAICKLSEQFIRICKARCIPYTAQIVTNGFCLNEDTFKMLYQQKIYEYMITVDGFREQHDRCRYLCNGAGTFDTIIRNLVNIRDNKHYRFAHIIIRINITRAVLNVLDDFIAYLDSMFSNDSRFSFLFIPVANYSKEKPTDPKVFVENIEVNDCLKRNHLYMEKFVPNNADVAMIMPATRCLASLKNSFDITPDLRIFKCHAHYEESTMGFMDLNGNMRIDEALNEKWYLTDKLLCKTLKVCETCFYKPACPINGKNCPYKYLISEKKSNVCPLENEAFIVELKNTVIEAAKSSKHFVVSL